MFNICYVSPVGGVDVALARRCVAHVSSLAVVIVYSVKASGSVPLGQQYTAALLLTGVQA